MCGIAVALPRLGAPRVAIDSSRLRAALGRRGPDSFDSWSGSLGHVWASRLILWDEGDAGQPYVDEGLVACFNGELFNLDHLRGVLSLPNASEVEVLARGLATEGVSFLRRVEGQFAGVVLDTRAGTALAFRDRFGICPLYYRTDEEGAYFASDLEALLALRPLTPRSLSWSGLASVICEWAAPVPISVWEGILQVEPGEAVGVASGALASKTQWPSAAGELKKPVEEGAAGLLGLMRQSVQCRTRSVGSIAVTLSGGVDSTIVAALAHEVGVDRSFGLVVPGEDVVRERQLAIAEALAFRHEVHELAPGDIVDDLQTFVATRMVPVSRLGPIGMMSLARYVRRAGVSAVLCGEGADELFCGYDAYRVMAARAGHFGEISALEWSDFGDPEFGAERGRIWATSYWRGLVAVAERADMRRSRILAPVLELFGPELQLEIRSRWQRELGVDNSVDALETRRHQDIRGLLASYLLTVQGDHAWMEEAVEQRPPWLDNDVAAWALSRPVSSHVSQAQGKTPIREMFGLLAEHLPGMPGMNFDKSAYRLDASFLLRDAAAWDRFVELIANCPDSVLDKSAVLRRATACQRAQRCSEAESMLFVFAASLGVMSGIAP